MTQYENEDKYAKVIKETSSQDSLRDDKKGLNRGIFDIDHIGTVFLMSLEVLKYPFIYLCCNSLVLRLGQMLRHQVENQNYIERYGSVCYFLGNLMFIAVCYVIMSLSGVSFKSKFSIFRHLRSLTKKRDKSLKSKVKHLKKAGKDLLRKSITLKQVIKYYVLHFMAGVFMGLSMLYIAYFLKKTGLIASIQTEAFPYLTHNKVLGALTICFVVPLIEEIIYRAHDMTILRKDFGVYKSSLIVTMIYLLFNLKTKLILLYIPGVYIMNVVFDKTRNIRKSVLYAASQPVSDKVDRDNIISIEGRHRNSKRSNVLSEEKSSDDANNASDRYNIAKLRFGRSLSLKPDITYSLLVNVGFHIALMCGWMLHP